MKYKLLAAAFLVSMVFHASAQGPGGSTGDYPQRANPDNGTNNHSSTGSGFDKSRLFFGGNFGAAFGYATIVNVSPQVGYRFTDYVAAGAGVNFIYYGYKDSYEKYRQTYAGLNVFGRVYPIRQFFIQAQPELNYMWGNFTYYDGSQSGASKVSQFVPSLLLGGGAAIPAGPGAITITVLYDVLQNVYSPYYRQAVYGFGYVTRF